MDHMEGGDVDVDPPPHMKPPSLIIPDSPSSPSSPHDDLPSPTSPSSSTHDDLPSPTSSSTPPAPSSPISSEPTAPKETNVIDHNSPYYRDYLLLMEFKHLPEKIAGGGIYAMPSFDSLYVWHCAIFIRQGVYRSGVFRFSLTIPSSYPNSAPEVRFFTPVFHPLIGADGTFDISQEFPDWHSKRHFLFKVLAYVKKVFYHLDLCISLPPLNKEAHTLYTTDRDQFLARAEESVRKSTENVFDNPEGSSIKFSPYTKEMDNMRDTILKGKAEKGDTLLSWVSKGVSSLISFKY